MRLRAGRPDLRRYAHLFDVPVADGGLSVTFLGVSTLLIDDGTCALLTDGYFSRPSLPRVVLGRVAPAPARIDGCLARAGVSELAAVLCLHTHLDHGLDSAVVAQRTGALLVGGASAANIGRGHGIGEDRLIVAESGRPMTYGSYDVTLIESEHCPPDRFPGSIEAPVRPPVRASAYRCGEAWSTLVAHRDSGRRLLICGSAGFRPGALAGHRADVVYLGVGQLGVQPRDYLVDYWTETVRTVGARSVVAIHWDDFFAPLTKPLRALPYAGDDLDASLAVLGELAAEDGVALRMPTVWRAEDPWAVPPVRPRSAASPPTGPAPRRSAPPAP